MDRYREELRELLEVKIPANSEAIGHALSFGDISENAELDAAREEQVQLTNKAQQMQENLARAELIEFDLISTDKVQIGAKVKLSGEGQETEYTLLGPWDVDLDKGIISYLSPIAQELIGSRCYDTVTLPKGEFKIQKISKYKD